MELWLNIVHYCIYKVDCWVHKVINKLNPLVLIGRIPAIKRKFEEQGTTHQDVVNKVWTDRRFGFGIMVSGGAIVVGLTFLIWGGISTVLGLLEVYFLVKPVYVTSYALMSFLICHFLVFRQEKYVRYFKMLDEKSKGEKWAYTLLSLLFIMGSVILWLFSFRFFPN